MEDMNGTNNNKRGKGREIKTKENESQKKLEGERKIVDARSCRERFKENRYPE